MRSCSSSCRRTYWSVTCQTAAIIPVCQADLREPSPSFCMVGYSRVPPESIRRYSPEFSALCNAALSRARSVRPHKSSTTGKSNGYLTSSNRKHCRCSYHDKSISHAEDVRTGEGAPELRDTQIGLSHHVTSHTFQFSLLQSCPRCVSSRRWSVRSSSLSSACLLSLSSLVSKCPLCTDLFFLSYS